jgi:Zn-dependent protease with chaperone function
MNQILYPNSPANVKLSQLKPSKEFKKEVIHVFSAVIFFFIVYLILVALAIVLAAGVSYLGIELILLKPSSFTLLIGIGMIGMGLLVLFFLIKFIFSIKKIDRSGFIEIKKNDHPDLYSFLQQLSNETKTKLPKRIYLAPDVNASVFYDSSFFSMLFPVKKNLVIGLGLVNSVNLSEFKAIIAHEFGHFSQESMRLGSYVYNVNKVIYNLLYENKGYANTIETWASTSGYFALFANLTVKIVQGIQWILQKLYVVINKSNLSLSRQMEHHADAVSAYVSGSNHMFSALNRLEIGDSCYNILLDLYNKWIPENYKPVNIYCHHQEVLIHFSKDKELNLSNDLPNIDSLYLSKIRKRRVYVKDQWASHPGTNERNEYIKSLNIDPTEVITEKPWILFNEPENVQKKLTDLIFSNVKYTGDIIPLDETTFSQKYYNDYQRNTFQKEYKGFYDNRRINTLNIEILVNENHSKFKTFEELYSENNCSLIAEKETLENDIALLKEINANPKFYKSFDYEGQKLNNSDAEKIINLLEKELSEINSKISEIDAEVFKYFKSQLGGEIVIEQYKSYYNSLNDFEKIINFYNDLFPHLSKIYNTTVKLTEAYAIVDTLKKYERPIKGFIKDSIDELKKYQYLNDEQIKKLDWFLSLERDYVDNQGYKDGELNVLNDSINIFISALAERKFSTQKILLQTQLDRLPIK